MSVAAADALIDACLFQPDQLPAAMEETARLLSYDYFCLVAADLTQSRFIASDRQREGIAAYFSGGWSDVDYRVHAEHSAAPQTQPPAATKAGCRTQPRGAVSRAGPTAGEAGALLTATTLVGISDARAL